MLKMEIKENVDLSPKTTLKVGGKAKYLAEITTEGDLESAVKFAHSKNLPIFVLGGGSNVLISDNGFNGLVIHVNIKGIEYEEHGENVSARAMAGETWDSLVEKVIEKGLWGIENLSGVPGNVGAAPVQNIGCYGAELSEVLEWVRVYDNETCKFVKLTNEDCLFDYRDSKFKRNKNYIVVEIALALMRDGKPNLKYFDLKEYFSNKTPDLKSIRGAVLEIRKRKGMVYDGTLLTAGSFFKTPIINLKELNYIKEVVSHDPKKASSFEPWFWEMGDNKYKVSPAFLMEFTPYNKTSYSSKVYKEGVSISPYHTLALINKKNASSKSFEEFISLIKKEINSKFNVQIELEVQIVGEANN